jgi:hypothetical protein
VISRTGTAIRLDQQIIGAAEKEGSGNKRLGPETIHGFGNPALLVDLDNLPQRCGMQDTPLSGIRTTPECQISDVLRHFFCSRTHFGKHGDKPGTHLRL